VGRARLDLQALTTLCVFAGIAEDSLLHSALPVLSSSANLDLNWLGFSWWCCVLVFFFFFVGLVCFFNRFFCFVLCVVVLLFFFTPKCLKITPALVTCRNHHLL